jgi:transcriptional regulator with XRE-family HTH domain
MAAVGHSRFPDELRRWRNSRRWSQLELALRAGTTQRHLSFMEQGRSAPGRTMVVRLAETLELSLRERNALLFARATRRCSPSRGWTTSRFCRCARRW